MKRPTSLILSALLILLALSFAGCSSLDGVPPTATPITGATVSPLPTGVATLAISPVPTGAPNGGSATSTPATLPPSGGPTATSTSSMGVEVPSPTIAAGEAPTATLVAEIRGTVISRVQPTSTPDASGMSPFAGIEDVFVFRLANAPRPGDFWVAHSAGTRNLASESRPQQHFVAIFERTGGALREVSRAELENPDYMSKGSVMQVSIEQSRAWLSVETGVGAHGGCFDLLSFDGTRLKNEVSTCATSPGAGSVQDLNGDGMGEVVLNATDNYVFCYACGVRRISFTIMRWRDGALSEVRPETLAPGAPDHLKRLNDRAVELFEHDLLKDAAAQIEQAIALDPANETVLWNRLVILLHADARRDHVQEGGYPLLANLFYGDYPAAVAILRGYSLDDLLTPGDESPLVKETAAEGNLDALVTYATNSASLALGAMPDLAAAYYVRGWAWHLAGNNSQAVIDVGRAAELDPAEKLYSDTLAGLKP